MRHRSQPSSRGKLTFVQALHAEIFRANSHQARNSKPMSASTGLSHAENGCARASTPITAIPRLGPLVIRVEEQQINMAQPLTSLR